MPLLFWHIMYFVLRFSNPTELVFVWSESNLAECFIFDRYKLCCEREEGTWHRFSDNIVFDTDPVKRDHIDHHYYGVVALYPGVLLYY